MSANMRAYALQSIEGHGYIVSADVQRLKPDRLCLFTTEDRAAEFRERSKLTEWADIVVVIPEQMPFTAFMVDERNSLTLVD